VRAYDTIHYEDLQVRIMLRNHQRAKSISDAGWSQFLGILACKAAGAGKRAVAVEPALTSQRRLGPHCGETVGKGLSVRWHACEHGDTSLHRGHNAALNVLAPGTMEQAAQKVVGGDSAVRRERSGVPWASPENSSGYFGPGGMAVVSHSSNAADPRN